MNVRPSSRVQTFPRTYSQAKVTLSFAHGVKTTASVTERTGVSRRQVHRWATRLAALGLLVQDKQRVAGRRQGAWCTWTKEQSPEWKAITSRAFLLLSRHREAT